MNVFSLSDLLLFLVLLSFRKVKGKSVVNHDSISCDDTTSQKNIIDWVRSNGGYFSSKQEFRRAVPGDPSSFFGIFTTDDIVEGELLTSVPWKCIINESDNSDELNLYFHCASKRKLISEMRKGDKSFYEPYTKYLLNQPRGKIPSDWSNAGKRLLEGVILGYDMLPPANSIHLLRLWKDWCNVEDDDFKDQLAQQAMIEYHTRGDDAVLIPLYDLHNHAQNMAVNVLVQVESGVKQNVVAKRSIRKGEQIGFSYNKSPHVDASDHKYYGTPEFLRDYGFIEPMPQRWWIKKIGFDVEERNHNTDDDDTGVKITWLCKPTPENETYLKDQLARLMTDVQPKLNKIKEVSGVGSCNNKQSVNCSSEPNVPPQSELVVILQYFDTLTTVISAALQSFSNLEESLDDCCNDDYDYDYDDDDIPIIV